MRDSLEEQARRYATQAHADAGQRRKYTDEPYIVHPAAVAELVRSVSDDEAMIAAAAARHGGGHRQYLGY